MYITKPDWSNDYAFPVAWGQIHGATLPLPGAACLLIRDSRGYVRCVWWDGAYVAMEPQTPAGVTSGFTAHSGTTMNSGSTSTGGIGTTALTFGDVVAILKQIGAAIP